MKKRKRLGIKRNKALLLQGSAMQIPLKAKSVQLCCFSPPYWGIRKYEIPPLVFGGDIDCEHKWETQSVKIVGGHSGGIESSGLSNAKKRAEDTGSNQDNQYSFCSLCGAWKGDLGLEPTPELYLDNMMLVMAECWRVLRNDGVCFVNIGDTYSQGSSKPSPIQATDNVGMDRRVKNLKPKSLCLIPQKLAIRCQEAGWIIRSEIIWNKPNPMPESCTDRPTRSHEQVWMMTKTNKTLLWKHRNGRWAYKRPKADYIWIHRETDEEQKEMPPKIEIKEWKRRNLWASYSYYWDQDAIREKHQDINRPNGFKGKNGIGVRNNNQGWTGGNVSLDKHRNYNPNGRNIRDVWTIATEPTPEAHFASWPKKLVARMIRVASAVNDIVLDPFCGTGKTIAEAERFNRIGVGLDLSHSYLSNIAMPRKKKAESMPKTLGFMEELGIG